MIYTCMVASRSPKLEIKWTLLFWGLFDFPKTCVLLKLYETDSVDVVNPTARPCTQSAISFVVSFNEQCLCVYCS